MMHESLGDVTDAIRCNEKVLELVPKGDLALRARTAIDGLRSRLN